LNHLPPAPTAAKKGCIERGSRLVYDYSLFEHGARGSKMEMVSVGKVDVSARIENLDDLYEADKGQRAMHDVRTVDVDDALVDAGATLLSVPQRLILQLGLRPHRTRSARTTSGTVVFTVHNPVRLTVQDRDCIIEVAEIPDDCTVLIGQVPLELLDFVVDPTGRKLIGNPEHGGEQMIDLL
jgi:predicted aspartyl protease